MRRAWTIPLSAAGLVLVCLTPGAWADGLKQEGEAQGSYVIRKGDTLWGIARERLQDPFRWPSIWEQNPYIADPDLIFPGDTLILPGILPTEMRGPVPAEAEGAATPSTPTGAASPATRAVPSPVEAPVEAPAAPAEAILPAEAKEPSPPATAADSGQQATRPQTRTPAVSPAALACSPILATEQMGIGEVVRSFDGRLMLSQEDRVFVGLASGATVKAGDSLAVVRRGQLVAHPATGRPLGRIVDTLGVLEILDVRDRVALAIIRRACDPIGIGDPIIPFNPVALPDVAPVPATVSLEGTIVGALRAEQLLALRQTVFLDLGADDGVGLGDVFAIYRPSLPAVTLTGVHPLPPERLGEAVIVQVTHHTATALITASPKESQVGDRAVLSLQAKP